MKGSGGSAACLVDPYSTCGTYSKKPGDCGGSAACLVRPIEHTQHMARTRGRVEVQRVSSVFFATEDEGVTGDAGTPAWRHIPNGSGGVSFFFIQRVWRGFVFQWSAQRARGDSFFNGSPNGGVGVGFFSMVRPTRLEGFRFSMVRPTRLEGVRFSMVRPTGLRGRGRVFFQWFAQRAWRGFVFQWLRGFVFQWSAQQVCGVGVGFFFNGSPNAPKRVSFFNGPPNRSAG